MLSIGAMTMGQEQYYSLLAREDYYLEGGEPPGVWLGRGAEALGLSGNVEGVELSNLFRGSTPDGEESLVQVQQWKNRERQPGWDLTFSAPKSVSTFWSMLGGEDRKLIEGIHFEAVRETVTYLEQVAGVTRRGHGGYLAEKAEFVVACYEHGTSRAQDPQIHTHCLFLNAGLRQDGSWGAIRSHDLYEHKMAAGAFYQAALAYKLTHELGLEVERDKGRSWGFELKHVPKALRDEHSTRRKEIEDALDKNEIKNAREAARACKATRHVKEHVAREELFPHWRSQGEEHSWTTELAKGLLGRTHGAYTIDPYILAIKAIEDFEQKKSFFSEREVVRAVCEGIQLGNGTPQDALAAAQKALSRDDIHRFKDREGKELFTTQKLRNLELGILAICENGKTNSRQVVKAKTLADVLNHKDFATIRDDQRKALEHITTTKGSVACVTGVAGTGKTYMINAARRAWEKEGLTVFGCALAATAAKELEEGSGIESRTITKTLMMLKPSISDVLTHEAKQLSWAARGAKKRYNLDRLQLNSKSVLVVDEASMVGTKNFFKLVEAAYEAGAKLVLLGDKDQLPSIEAGAPFAGVMQAVGAAKLTEITRQQEEWMKDAVRQFARGDAFGALTQYSLAGRLHIKDDIVSARESLIEAWNNGRTDDLKQTAILAGTREDVKVLNSLAQAKQKERGELGKISVLHDDTRFFSGDRIQFTENRTSLGVRNGQYGTIERITPSILSKKTIIKVKLDDTVRKGLFMRNRRVSFTLGNYEAIQLGYATTTHKFQGGTVDKSYILAGGWMQDRELSYVQMSRAREETQIFTTVAHAGEDLCELQRATSRSRSKEMSIEKERVELGHIQDQQREQERTHELG